MSPVPNTNAQSESLLAPSAQFKREAAKSIVAIIAFIVVYILLFALSLLLAGLCLYGGFSLIVFKPAFYTLLIGGGLMACGVMVFVFLVKFLFAATKADNSDSVEITAADQPRLFQTINEIAEAAGARKPRKVFLSPDVNAAVFYNSSFWSLFFPVRKNLKIGLGLVNALNVSELKAVLAHEFGHFSQRSMKVGSWVYQVNKIIHDMLFNNNGYANSLNSLASVHGVFSFFVQLTVQVVKGIQWVLHQMFRVVNQSYLSLSRQMEFHADLVAASLYGSNNINSALKRSEFADSCLATTLDVCNVAWKEKKVVGDVYTMHHLVETETARLNQLHFVNGLPVLNDDEESGIANRVNYKDQWASHPTLQERKAYLESFGLTAAVDAAPAWTLFRDSEKLKEELTRHFYKSIPASEVSGTIDLPQFETLFKQQVQAFSFPPAFRGFYNNRVVTLFDPEAVAKAPFVLQPYESILTEEAAMLPKRIQYLEQDIAVLQAIVNGDVATRSFDFDGQKYARKEATAVLAQLEGEKEAAQQTLEALDQAVFRYFYAILPLAEAEALKAAYRHYFEQRSNADAFVQTANNMMEGLGPVFRGESMSIETAQSIVAKLKETHEPPFKHQLRLWLTVGAFDGDASVKSAVEKFLSTHYEYFSGSSFFDNELNELAGLVSDSWNGISNHVFSLFKAIAEIQDAALQSKTTVVSE